MLEQLTLDWSAAARTAKHRKRLAAVAAADAEQPSLFPHVPSVDLTLGDPGVAVAHATGADPERTLSWLSHTLGGGLNLESRKRATFDARLLERLLCCVPPAHVTFDTATLAVARALVAEALGLGPLRVRRERRRLRVSSPRWGHGLAMRDVPWTAVVALYALGVNVEIDPDARALVSKRLGQLGAFGRASLAGSTVLISTKAPDLVESLDLPALAYAGPPGIGEYRMPLLAATELLRTKSVSLTAELEKALRELSHDPKPVVTKPSFPWKLYDFQARDVATAARIVSTTGGVLLAGTMGTGKTTVSLALLDELEAWPALVVAPLAALSTWARQLGEMGKDFYLAVDSVPVAWEQIQSKRWDAVVVTYDRLHAMVELIENWGFSSIVADEVQRIRTPSSRRSRALRSLSGAVPIRIGLSGTPLQNRLPDLLPLGAWLAPAEWPARPGKRDLSDLYVGEDPVASVAQHLSTLMVRRRMEDTGVEIPGGVDHRLYVNLTAEQIDAIKAVEDGVREDVASGAIPDTPQGKIHVFAKMGKIRQIISCPEAVGVGGGNPKINAAVALASEYVASGRKTVVFVANRAAYQAVGRELERAGIGWVGIWGASSPQDRFTSERRFHNDPSVQVFIGTIQACSESLTLSPTGKALIYVDMVYDLGAMSQSRARIVRLNMDKDRPVDIVTVIAKGTMDERIVEILAEKQALFSKVIDNEEWSDQANISASLEDLMYVLLGDT